MRYVLISDVHANLPALAAVLNDVERRLGSVPIFHLGDLVGYAPWPNETVDLLRERGIGGVSGNYDSTVGLDYLHCGCKYENPEQAELSHLSFEWTKRHSSPSTRAYLAALPFRLDLRPLGGHGPGPRVVLVHGAPSVNTLYWTEERPDEFCTRMAVLAGATAGDLICFGHTHRPWHRVVDGIHFVNTGSVGRPKDGDWRAGYVVLDFASAEPTIEFVRVEYDLEAAVRGIRESELPDQFAADLETGGAPQVSIRRPPAPPA